MKLFVCLTSYHLLCACALACCDGMGRHELLFEAFQPDETELIAAVRKSRIFKNVYYIDQRESWAPLRGVDSKTPDSQVGMAVQKVSDLWKKTFPDFDKLKSKYEDICIWDDHFTFGMALAFNSIPYNYYEESPGCHYRRELFVRLSQNGITNKAFAPTTELYGLRGKYPYAVSYNYDFELNPMERKEKDRDFSLVQLLSDIRKERKKII